MKQTLDEESTNALVHFSSDYDDFITFDKDSIEELIPKVEEFIAAIEVLVVNG